MNSRDVKLPLPRHSSSSSSVSPTTPRSQHQHQHALPAGHGGSRGSRGVDAYTRHQRWIHDYMVYYGGQRKMEMEREAQEKAEATVGEMSTSVSMREKEKQKDPNFRFVRDARESITTLQQYEAKKYYDGLFKEFVLVDLSRYMSGEIGMRWRVESEVISGKGQFICGNIVCNASEIGVSPSPLSSPPAATVRVKLKSVEVLFSYEEEGEVKSTLVKARLCGECYEKMAKYRDGKRRKEREKERKHGRSHSHSHRHRDSKTKTKKAKKKS